MCIRDRGLPIEFVQDVRTAAILHDVGKISTPDRVLLKAGPVSYTHLRAHETVLDLVCRLLLETKNDQKPQYIYQIQML